MLINGWFKNWTKPHRLVNRLQHQPIMMNVPFNKSFFSGSKCTQGQKIPKPDRCNLCDCVEGHIVCTNFECRPLHRPSSTGNFNKPALRRYRIHWTTIFLMFSCLSKIFVQYCFFKWNFCSKLGFYSSVCSNSCSCSMFYNGSGRVVLG